MRFAIFPVHLSKVLRLPRKINARSYEVLHLSRKIISANLKIWGSKMEPFWGNQRPDFLTSLMNMSLVLCRPREMHLCRSSSNVPRLPMFLKLLQNPSRFAHFWQGAQSLAPTTQNDIWTSKSAPYPSVFCTFDFEMCFAPQRRALFRLLNFQKWSDAEVVCTFWLRNELRATTAYNFSSLTWPAGSAPAALASLLFDPLEPQISGKTQCFATFLPFRASASSFFWLFLFSDLLSSNLSLLSASALLCFSSVHIVGSLTSKLPSPTLQYTTLEHTTVHFTTLHYANYTTPQLQLQLQLHYTNYTTLQQQLHYTTLQLQVHYTTLHPAVVGEVTTATIATIIKKHNSNHLSVHQWIRCAIRDSQRPTSPIGFLSLKLPPPLCAVLLASKAATQPCWFFSWLDPFCIAPVRGS